MTWAVQTIMHLSVYPCCRVSLDTRASFVIIQNLLPSCIFKVSLTLFIKIQNPWKMPYARLVYL